MRDHRSKAILRKYFFLMIFLMKFDIEFLISVRGITLKLKCLDRHWNIRNINNNSKFLEKNIVPILILDILKIIINLEISGNLSSSAFLKYLFWVHKIKTCDIVRTIFLRMLYTRTYLSFSWNHIMRTFTIILMVYTTFRKLHSKQNLLWLFMLFYLFF